MMKKMKCRLCEHEWLPRVDLPKECPKCHSYYYNGNNKNKTIRGKEDGKDSSS
jgi:predicted Zn-ribbon and HTH transcriptional regulator